MSAMGENQRQVGGTHYQQAAHCPHCGSELQHWDIAWMFGMDCFQYIITKWLFRWRAKDGLSDLEKARHALDKYIEMNTATQPLAPGSQAAGVQAFHPPLDRSGEPGGGYTNQDR